MEVFIAVAVVVVAVIGWLWWIDRRNPGKFGSREIHAEDYSAETRKDWGPR
jgi:hypothetical protein